MDGIVCERWHKYRGFGKAKGRLDLSEAPQAYKDIESVIDSERDLVEPLVRLGNRAGVGKREWLDDSGLRRELVPCLGRF